MDANNANGEEGKSEEIAVGSETHSKPEKKGARENAKTRNRLGSRDDATAPRLNSPTTNGKKITKG